MAVGDAFGDFSEVTFNDGMAPPINATNLNEMEGLLAITDLELERSKSFKLSEYLEYFRKRNQQDIDQYQDGSASYSNQNPAAASLSDEDTENVLGDLGLNVNIDDNGANWFGFDKTFGSAYDLTEFYDESASSTDDMICILFYVHDGASIQGSGGFMYFNIGNGGVGNTYEYDFDIDAWGFDSGWNVAWVPKSSFYVWAGAPNWNNIDYYQIQMDYNAGYQNEYFIFNLIQMNRHDPVDSDYPNPFQRYMGSVSNWENLFTIPYDVFSIVKDINIKTHKLGIMKFNPPNYESPFTPGNYKNGMLICSNVNSFLAKFEWICKVTGELPSMTFYIDSTHYAEVYCVGDTLYLSVANGGAAVNTTAAFVNALDKNEKVVIFFEKQDDTLRAICYKHGEILTICEYETTFSTYGDIYLGVVSDDSFGILTDFAISHSMNQLKLAKRNIPIVVRKLEDEIVNNSSTLQNDDDIWCYLMPNQTYKIELHAIVGAAANNTDVKISWSLSDGAEVCERHVIGPDTGCAAAYSTEVKISRFSLTASAVYGTENTVGREVYIQETFIIRSGELGGKLQMQWSQYSAAASDTTMKENTIMIVTPVEMR
jgi:hypothetical protein